MCYAAAVRRIGLLGLGMVLAATTALAAEKKGLGTLARLATPGRFARLAEIAKDATPPKPGSRRGAERLIPSSAGRRIATR